MAKTKTVNRELENETRCILCARRKPSPKAPVLGKDISYVEGYAACRGRTVAPPEDILTEVLRTRAQWPLTAALEGNECKWRKLNGY